MSFVRSRRWCLTLGLLTAWGLMLHAAVADRIVTVTDQTLEGIIRGQDNFYVTIDVRGTRIAVPRERIKSIWIGTPEENLSTIIQRTEEALVPNDLALARALVDQGKEIPTTNTQLFERLMQLDRHIAELERRGGTPQQRRQRAEDLFQKARQAYDRIRQEEGNALLLQALRIDPTFEPAHRRLNEILASARPDYQLAAEYFADVMWPDHVQPDSPVIAMLPEVYRDLADRFDQTTDVPRAVRYAQLMRTINEALQARPEWWATADESERAMLGKSADLLLAELVEHNLDRRQYDLALAKLQSWAKPDDSPQTALLFARCLIGTGDTLEAERILTAAAEAHPDIPELALQRNAVQWINQASAARREGRNEQALETLNRVYASRENVLPEIGQTVGRQLALLRLPELNAPTSAQRPWQTAATAALVMRYAPNPADRRRAAQMLASVVPFVGWKLDLQWQADGQTVPLPPALLRRAEAALARPLGLQFDPNSSFVLRLIVDTRLQGGSADDLIRAASAENLNDPSFFPQPVLVMALAFTAEARELTLGEMLRTSWAAAGLPPEVAQARGLVPTPTPTESTGGQPGIDNEAAPADPPPFAPELQDDGAVISSPPLSEYQAGDPQSARGGGTRRGQPGAGRGGQRRGRRGGAGEGTPGDGARTGAPAMQLPTAVPVSENNPYILIRSMESVGEFIDKELVHYLVPLQGLPGKLRIEGMQELLAEQARAAGATPTPAPGQR